MKQPYDDGTDPADRSWMPWGKTGFMSGDSLEISDRQRTTRAGRCLLLQTPQSLEEGQILRVQWREGSESTETIRRARHVRRRERWLGEQDGVPHAEAVASFKRRAGDSLSLPCGSTININTGELKDEERVVGSEDPLACAACGQLKEQNPDGCFLEDCPLRESRTEPIPFDTDPE